MIIKANQEDTNEILKYAAQSLLKDERNCQLSTEKAIEITKPIVEKGAYYLIVKEANKVMGWILIGKIQTIFLVKNLDLYMNCTFSQNIAERIIARTDGSWY